MFSAGLMVNWSIENGPILGVFREAGRVSRHRGFESPSLRHSVLDVGYSLRSLPKIRAYRPNLHLLRHQRQASSSDSVRNSALYLCFEFRWGREELFS